MAELNAGEQRIYDEFFEWIDERMSVANLDADHAGQYKNEVRSALLKVDLNDTACSEFSQAIKNIRNICADAKLYANISEVLSTVNGVGGKYGMRFALDEKLYLIITVTQGGGGDKYYYYKLSYSTAYGTPPSTITVRSFSRYYSLTSANLPTLTASGYIFNGWLINGSLASVGTIISADTTLTASWSVATVTYVISYSTAYGIAPASKTITVNEGESYSLTSADLPTLTTSGYIFNGWLMNGSLVSVGTTISANTTLIASWTAITVDYTISYSTTHGTAPESKTVTVNEGESYALTADDLPTLTAKGYIFEGWSMNGVIVSTGDAIIANSTLVAVWTEDIASIFNKAWGMLGYVISKKLILNKSTII